MNIDRNQLMAILEAFEDETDFTIRNKVKLADRIIDGLGPRYLIHTCAACKKEQYREPMPINYPKTDLPKMDNGDIVTHTICPTCMKKLYPDYCK